MIIAIAMMLGIAMYWLHISAVKALLFTTVLYGITAPFLIGIIMHIANNKKIMGQFCNNRLSNIIGLIALFLMFGTLLVLGFYTFIK